MRIGPASRLGFMKAPTGERWIHEIKYDGFRLMAYRNADGVRLRTRQAADYTSRYSRIVLALEKLNVKSICLDGEVMWNDSLGIR
jgi:bifunctional non-homologous end joining protein LigD